MNWRRDTCTRQSACLLWRPISGVETTNIEPIRQFVRKKMSHWNDDEIVKLSLTVFDAMTTNYARWHHAEGRERSVWTDDPFDWRSTNSHSSKRSNSRKRIGAAGLVVEHSSVAWRRSLATRVKRICYHHDTDCVCLIERSQQSNNSVNGWPRIVLVSFELTFHSSTHGRSTSWPR